MGMFLKNAWYAAAWDHEVTTDKPLARTILNEPLVLFRDTSGRIAALEDRCCHRHLPLSKGKVMGDILQCGYHGLKFDTSGACVGVPGQTRVPPGSRIRSWPVLERFQFIWVWMGDADKADESLLPNW